MNDAQRKVMIEWHKKIRILAKAHCQESVRTEKKNVQLGIPVVILTAIAGGTVFALYRHSLNLLFRFS